MNFRNGNGLSLTFGTAKSRSLNAFKLCLVTILLSGLILSLPGARVARAETFNVNPGDTEGFLDAIRSANDGGEDEAESIINLAPNSVYLLNESEVYESWIVGVPPITGKITINGNGSTITRETTPVEQEEEDPTVVMEFRLFLVLQDAKLTLKNLNLSNGQVTTASSVDQRGAGILNLGGTVSIFDSAILDNKSGKGAEGAGIYNLNGTLNLSGVTVIRNVTGDDGSGGGIYNDNGTVNLSGSNITGNKAGSSGGGIYNKGTINLIASTVNENSAGGAIPGLGGGIYNQGTINLVNSTVSGNIIGGRIGGSGGGIANKGGTLNIASSTIAQNRADLLDVGTAKGGGIYIEGGTVKLKNSLIASNFAKTNIPSGSNDISGGVSSQGFNLIGNTQGGSGFVETDLQNLDPKVETLKNNGGPTPTHALSAGSPAINAANPDGCTDYADKPITTDQRFNPRPQGGRCDIGAFEV